MSPYRFLSSTGRTFSRRGFLQISSSVVGSLTGITPLLGAATPTSRTPERAARRHLPVVILYNAGGPPPKETFTPDEPTVAEELRGGCSAISTRVTGIHYSEHWPMLAARNDRFSLLRGLDSGSSDHFQSARNMLRPGGAGTFGIVWGERAADGGVPYTFVEVPSTFSVMDAMEVDKSLRVRWRRDPDAPAATGSDWEQALVGPGRYVAPEIRPDPQLRQRAELLRAFDQGSTLSGPSVDRRDRCYDLALGLLLGGGTFFEAFNPPKRECAEYERDRTRYGRGSRVGEGLLLSRRLAERGAGVCVLYNERGQGWDMHSDLIARMRVLAAETDRAAAALLDDIHTGRFNGIFVMVGEFARTPRVNSSGGRDHWGAGFPGIFAGGKFRKGITHGAVSPLGVIRSGRVPVGHIPATITKAAGGEVSPNVPRVGEILES